LTRWGKVCITGVERGGKHQPTGNGPRELVSHSGSPSGKEFNVLFWIDNTFLPTHTHTQLTFIQDHSVYTEQSPVTKNGLMN
jgi:hypothetical protein